MRKNNDCCNDCFVPSHDVKQGHLDVAVPESCKEEDCGCHVFADKASDTKVHCAGCGTCTANFSTGEECIAAGTVCDCHTLPAYLGEGVKNIGDVTKSALNKLGKTFKDLAAFDRGECLSGCGCTQDAVYHEGQCRWSGVEKTKPSSDYEVERIISELEEDFDALFSFPAHANNATAHIKGSNGVSQAYAGQYVTKDVGNFLRESLISLVAKVRGDTLKEAQEELHRLCNSHEGNPTGLQLAAGMQLYFMENSNENC